MIVGHDWGAPVAWHAAMFRPDIFSAVAGLSVPPPLRGRAPAAGYAARRRDHQFLLAIFPDRRARRSRVRAGCRLDDANVCSDADFPIRRPRCSSRIGKGFLGDAAPDRPLPDWLSEADLAYFTEAYQKSGFRGGLELVPKHRPQLGTDRAVARRANPSAVTVHRGIEGFRHHRA